MPRLPIEWHDSAAQASLAPPAKSPEWVIPLWWHSGTVGGEGNTTPGSHLMQKGSAVTSSNSASSAVKLHNLNSNWPLSTNYALEITLGASSTGTAYAALWDLTLGSIVASSQVQTTLTTVSVLRSGKFTLTPGHVYGVTTWTSSTTSVAPATTDASLIVFP